MDATKFSILVSNNTGFARAQERENEGVLDQQGGL
jgi:hypothetical protein